MALHHRLIARAARGWWWLTRLRTLGVRAIVLDPAGRVLLVRHTYRRYWYLPGGGVEKGESLYAAIVRELAEEVGLTVATPRLLAIFHSRLEYKDDHVALFEVRIAAAVPATAVDRREIAEASWFATDALPSDVSPATARRIEEFLSGAVTAIEW